MSAKIGTPTKASAPCTPDLGAIREQVFAIDLKAGDINILMAAVFEKLDSMVDLSPRDLEAANAINCFATCALHNIALIKAASENIFNLVVKGGEA